jgi:hypothetical protein
MLHQLAAQSVVEVQVVAQIVVMEQERFGMI